jgi:o-succinylbenzoate synthase
MIIRGDGAIHVFAVAMRAKFRGIEVREGILVRGPSGWAEFSPFWDYGPATCVPWLRAAREAAYDIWPAAVRDRIPVNCTVPAVDPARARGIVAASNGCRTAKVKVAEPGQSEHDDLARVEAVREALGPGGHIRVDANGGWDVDTAVAMIGRLDKEARGLEYVEQPCASVEDLAKVRRKVGVPIAADESIRRADDPYRVVRMDAADIAVIKVQPLGGIRAALRIVEQIGLPVVVSSALETSVGLAAGVALAAALPDLPYACGLATTQLLSADVVADSFVPVDGSLPVVRSSPDPDLLGAVAADAATHARWIDRLAAVEALA